MYSPQEMLQDYVERTLKNLDYIETCVTSYGRKVYEVTQVINSLLGVVVFPHEMAGAETPIISLDDPRWPKPVRDMERYFQTMPDFLRCWRHAIAHGNIQFSPSNNNDIESVKFQAICDYNKRDVKWEISLSVEEIFVLVKELCAMWSDNHAVMAFPVPPHAIRNRG